MKSIYSKIRVGILMLAIALIIIPETRFYGVALALVFAGKSYIALTAACCVVESLYYGKPLIGLIAVVAAMILLNVYEVIYSRYIMKHAQKDRVGSEQLSRMAEEHITYHFTEEEGAAFVKMLDLADWTDAEAFREWKYHKRGYFATKGLFPKINARFAYADFERKQTFKTYLYRFIGNCFFW